MADHYKTDDVIETLYNVVSSHFTISEDHNNHGGIIERTTEVDSDIFTIESDELIDARPYDFNFTFDHDGYDMVAACIEIKGNIAEYEIHFD